MTEGSALPGQYTVGVYGGGCSGYGGGGELGGELGSVDRFTINYIHQIEQI